MPGPHQARGGSPVPTGDQGWVGVLLSAQSFDPVATAQGREMIVLDLIILILILCWLGGWIGFGGFHGLVHLLLVIAVVVLVYRVLTGRLPR